MFVLFIDHKHKKLTTEVNRLKPDSISMSLLWKTEVRVVVLMLDNQPTMQIVKGGSTPSDLTYAV